MGKPAFITNFSNKPAKQQRPSGSRTQTNHNKKKSSFQETFTNIGETFSTTFSSVNNFRKKLIWNRIRLVVCVLMILMFIVQIVVTAAPSWLHLSDSYEQGLWKVCTQVEDGTECFSYNKFPGYFKVIQALLIISILLYPLAFIYFLYMIQRTTWPPFLLTACLAVIGIFTVISLAVFTDNNLTTATASPVTFGWTYYFGWINVLICFGTSTIILYDHRYT